MLPGCYRAGYERTRHTALGRELCPLTLGHARVLYLAGSPLVCGAGEVSAGDLLLTIAICSRPVPPTAAELDALAAEGLRCSGDDVAAAAGELAAYISYWTARHPQWEGEGSNPPRVPWPWHYAAFLEGECNMTEAQAWATTCADAFWRAAAWCARNGSRSLFSLAELDVMAEMSADSNGH